MRAAAALWTHQIAIARQSTDPVLQSQAVTLAPADHGATGPNRRADVGCQWSRRLAKVASTLPGYGINTPDVQVIGPATWARDESASSNLGGLTGAWFAAPDPSFRTPPSSRPTSPNTARPPHGAGRSCLRRRPARHGSPWGICSVITQRERFPGGGRTCSPCGRTGRSLRGPRGLRRRQWAVRAYRRSDTRSAWQSGQLEQAPGIDDGADRGCHRWPHRC